MAGKTNPAKKRDLVIVVNPGSTSTKLAVYRGPKCLAEQAINHPKDDLAKFDRVADQYEFRLDAVMAFLADCGVELDQCLAIAGRGGLTKPLTGGVYRVNARMIRDLRSGRWGEHPSSLGAPLAQEIGRRAGAPAFITDPVVPPGLRAQEPLPRPLAAGGRPPRGPRTGRDL